MQPSVHTALAVTPAARGLQPLWTLLGWNEGAK